MTVLHRTHSENPDFKKLTNDLDIVLCEIYNTKQADYEEYNRIVNLDTIVLAYEDKQPVGCGCFKIFSDNAVEIKRMFVKEDQRGKGNASAILEELEVWAKELGYKFSVLETGKKQPEAIRLYQKQGYSIIPNYGQYDGLDNSVCMKKEL